MVVIPIKNGNISLRDEISRGENNKKSFNDSWYV